MTDKRIKNEQWSVKELISKIDNKEIKKPKFQRKQKWDTLPKKNSSPNDYAYIKFLYDTENSVHAITFGQETNSKGIFYSNIDGNNRINAIQHFMDKPFEIFSKYLDDLFKIFDDINSENILKIKEIFKPLPYNKIIKIRDPCRFFKSVDKSVLFKEIQSKQIEIGDEIINIQNKLMINESDFGEIVKINVNIFEGYNTDELCKTFEAINKYNSKLTETELLACRLHNICDFTINNKPFETELIECIEEYYKDKCKKEVLVCYKFEEEMINAHDFIVGFQNLCNQKYKYKFIGKTDVDGLSLFFKLWKVLNKSFIDTFTTENVNDFIEKINYSCDILQETISNIFTDKISDKLFYNSCQTKLKTLKKNHWFMLICCIIGYKNTKETKCIIIKNLEKALIYHFFICDLKNEEIRRVLKMDDPLLYKSGVSWIDSTTKIYLDNPNTISNKLNKELFEKIISALYNEMNSPYERKLENGKNKNDKRRKIKFFEKTLMFYYYKGKIPTNMLDNEFSIEHIIPNSSEWEGELDKDRTGNLIPIISTINSQRGNKHINSYKKTTEGKDFYEFIKDIIPNDEVYNTIINHDNKTPKIINTEKYNEMCEKNEQIYKQNFVDCLFK
jgi:hypothetical protein